ncbi:hypothetical protein L5515_017033 [Caenorhabditis briggsae]|uniref:receptor protein-tyrosine kinase n=2 Tax=Caenorhabditis briggsae TaxID=6238 RepID=A0AAE9FFZ8_CAEBR|nr:hypothetical protein L5515_017033 [Caenorhabditis briggsae]
MNTSLSVQWEVAIENEQPDVHITVHEPSLFTVLNQQFYPPDTHLRVDCVSISIPPADVTFERTDRESGDFVEIDQELLKTYAGTFERRFVWNMTLDEDTELRCTSTRNGNKYPATKAIIVTDQFFTVFSAFEKSDKATSRELPNVIYEGDNVKLTCVVPNEAADWDVSWRFKNKTLELSGTEVRGHSKLLVLDLNYHNFWSLCGQKYFPSIKNKNSPKRTEMKFILICYLFYKLQANKKITKQKDIKLNMLYQMIRSDPGPMPEYLTELPIEERTDYLPYPRKFEIARENLEICAKMGSVKFGFVEKGYLSMADPKSQIECKTRLPVAIKSTKRSFDVELQTMLFEELKIMCAIEKHPNVISLIGAVTTNMRKGEIYLVTEYADSGDFLNYLQKRKDIFHNGLFDDQQKTESTRFLPSGDNLSTLDLLSFALQIANGMKFLATVPCVHRDLAARNVLITKKKSAELPILGLPDVTQIKITIEALETLKFTEKIDVWSYGITLYEIFTLGGQPYPHVQTEDIKAFLKSGKRNEQPEYCHYDVPTLADETTLTKTTHHGMRILLGILYLVTANFAKECLVQANDAQVKLKWIVRSRQILRGKEVKQASLSAKFAFYPLDGKSYIPFENEQPDVQITVREPSSFIVFNQQFYPPDAHLHIDCVSISIPPADVTFERKNRESGDFEEIDRELLMSVEGTFERGFIWNTTLDDDTELRCTSTRNGNKYTAIKSIIVADEAFTVFSAIEKSDKATSLELPNVIYEGDNVKLTCVVPNGAADWNVSWRFKNNDLESSDTEVKGHSKLVVLDLKDITPSSSGKYQCVVKKGESEEFQEIVLKVESISKPYHTDAESRSTVTVNYDETFVIDCGMTGNPLPDVKWFKGGHQYTSGDMEGSILKVSRARAEGDGQFQCLAVNRAGLTSNFIEVQVDNVPERSSFFYWFLTILVLAAIILICYLFYKLRANKKITKQKDIQLNMLYLMKQNDPGPLPENLKLLPIEERADYLRYPEEFEIARENMEICEKIGSGMFGFVNTGYLSMADPKSQIEYKTRLPVAIKSTKKSFDMELQTMLFEELKIMCAIEKHPNVISLIGAVTTNMRKGEFYLVTEYADNGDLLNYLRKHRETFHNTLIDMEEPVVNENYSVPSQQIEYTRLLPSSDILSTADLLSFALQIANGMEFLAAVPCVHRDLAARNVLITSSKICRIADFGLAKRYTDKNYYRIKNGKQVNLPVRWMAPESVQTYKFTEKNDVWSYGITLYEIFTLGNRPYAQVPNEQLEEFLRSGMRNEQPEYCHDDLYALMKNCWHKSPDVRPNFNTCVHYLKAHLKECAGELLNRVDGQLDLELEEQYKLEEWLMKNRPDIQGGTFTRKPKNNEEEEAPTERYLIVESST